MCGISSIVNKGKEKIDIVALKHMAAVMSYRGPDQSGFATFASETIGFAHVRLAIQDPFAEPQPLVVKLGQDVVALCYNGEIYDVEKQRELLKELGYSFQTTTDTEVVLNLYLHHGLEFTKLLNGEFGFLLYDSRSDRLLAGRDRYGVKPLFYHTDDERIIFASEAKAILSCPTVFREFAPNFLTSHLWGGFSSFESPFKGILPVPPGHYLLYESGHLYPARPYWAPSFNTNPFMTKDEAQEGVRERLKTAVERRLIADAPVCSYLSGGIDSALVTGLASESRSLHAFNISFSDSVFDEKADALAIASHYGVECISISCPPARLATNLIQTVWHTEQFFPNPSAIGKYILSAEVQRRGYKVALTGEGSDEILAGYPTFKLEALWRMAESTNTAIRAKAAGLMDRFCVLESRSEGLLWNNSSKWKTSARPLGFASASYLRSVVYEPFRQMALRKNHIKPNTRATDAFIAHDASFLAKIHPLQASMVIGYHHLASWIFPCLGDRLEMAHHVEGRTPFLDNDLTEFVSTIPPEYLIDIGNLQEKAILYGAFRDYLPARTAASHKHPFLAPSWAAVLESPSGLTLCQKFLSNRALSRTGVFRSSVVRVANLLWKHVVPRHTTLFRKLDAFMGMVVCVQIMHHHFIATRPGPDFLSERAMQMKCIYQG